MLLDAGNLPDLARGCAVLGTGGGGDPETGLLMSLQAVEDHGPVPLLDLDELPDDGLLMPCGGLGAPTVSIEKFGNGAEGARLCEYVERLWGKPVVALMSSEIGGSNGLVPVAWAAGLGLPVVDADGMGRAFPEMQQAAMELAGISPNPAVMTDERGNTHFRPLEVVTRPGSLFHALPPAPCYLYGWASDQAMEVIYGAIAQAMPEAVPACSGGDICALVWWGRRAGSGESWTDGSPYPIGQGGHVGGDGANSLIHISESATRFPPTEVWEAKNPSLLERVELAPDSCGPGRNRGGLGVDIFFRALEDCWLTSTVERQRNAPWGLAGGREARPNSVRLVLPDGSERALGKETRVRVAAGARVELRTGGRGGHGPPVGRSPEAIRRDLRDGYVTEGHARRNYPHAFLPEGEADALRR